MPENNHCLISLEKSTIKEYCLGLAKTANFMSSLYPELIFHRYNDEPSLDVWNKLIIQCENNLKVSTLYLASIVLSFSIVDAICSRFCSHTTLSFLFSFSTNTSTQYASVIDFLPAKLDHNQNISNLEKKVLYLIHSQPKPDFLSTLEYSDLVYFIVNYLGLEKVAQLLPNCYVFMEEQITGQQFLQCIPNDLINI